MKSTDLGFKFIIPEDVLEDILETMPGGQLASLIADMQEYLQNEVMAGIIVQYTGTSYGLVLEEV